MTDRPIIFSAPMVRALLAGRKTQTRRVMKPQPVQHLPDLAFSWGKFTGLWPDDWFGNGGEIDDALPYAVGDRLYVREAWRIAPDACEGWVPEAVPCVGWIDYRAGGCAQVGAPSFSHVLDAFGKAVDVDWDCLPDTWRPSIYMPRWASRLTLTVTDVRVQRLQAISEEDAVAEGIVEHEATMTDPAEYTIGPDSDLYFSATEAFRSLWNSLHGTDAWTQNPWVVALTFTVEQRNIDQ